MPDSSGPRGVERHRFSSRDAAETTEFIRRMYVGNRTRFHAVDDGSGAGERTGFRVVAAVTGRVAADRVRSTLDVESTTEPFAYLVFDRVRRGRMDMTAGREETRLGPGEVGMYPLGVPLTARARQLDMEVLRLPLAEAAARATELTGIDPADLRFESVRPVSRPMERYWRAVFGLVGRELMAPDSAMASPLVADQLVQGLASAALSVFPNTTMTVSHLPGPGHVAPAALRRAVAHIDAHAGRPLALADIAAAAGVGARALQYAFARHHGTSPTGYLRRVRLERAHRDLQAADPARGDTVAAIAARWGFAKPGRFAAAYRAAYGRPPSRTLHT